MKYLQKMVRYLLDPRAGSKPISQADAEIGPRTLSWKGVLNFPFLIGCLILIAAVIIIWFGPKLASYDPYITTRSVPTRYDAEKGIMVRPPFDPSAVYPLGTDHYGNDILSLILYGARVTILTSLYITIARIALGLALGGAAGWQRGSGFDQLLQKLISVITSIPLLLSTMLLILSLDITRGSWIFIFALSVLGWTEIAQLVRGEVVRIKSKTYIEAAKSLGLTRIGIFVRHALPNILSYLLSIFFLEMAAVLLLMAELGYLGLFVGGGTRFRQDEFSPIIILREIPEWGALVAQATPYLRSYPYMVLGPSAAFFITIVGLNAFGEGLRRTFERWPFSTGFLLKKEMVLALCAFCGVTLLIFQRTNASVAYQRAAEEYSSERADFYLENLKAVSTIALPDEESPLQDYLVAALKDLEIQPGWSETINRYHYFSGSAAIVKPAAVPRLEIGSLDAYQYQQDFSFASNGYAGAGLGQGPVHLMVGGCRDNCRNLIRDQGSGRILLIPEEDLDLSLIEEAAAAGVEGLLLVTRSGPPLTSQFEIGSDDPGRAFPDREIPVFWIREETAQELADEAGHLWEIPAAREPYLLDLKRNGVISLELTAVQDLDVPNLVGFWGGYDMDHADELIVVFTSFDGLGLSEVGQQQVPASDLERIAVLLEILASWQDSKVDPRRSVLFVAWGGKGVDLPLAELVTGLFETNRLVAKVPTNIIPFINSNPVKPAFWIEIGDLSGFPDAVRYAYLNTDYLPEMYKKAARAAGLPAVEGVLPEDIVSSDLPSIYIWDARSESAGGDMEDVGIFLNRFLIQLVRDMDRR